MAYGNKYILSFSNDLGELYEVFFNYLNYTGGSSSIIGVINALTLRCTSADDDRLYPVNGTECLINILVGTASTNGVLTDDSGLNIYDLIATQDNQIQIIVYKDLDYTKSIYQGFVVVENNAQPFIDPPFTLSVRALDGLGLLKGTDMVDLNGQLYAGLLNVQDWIGNILYKTGVLLNIRFYFPFYAIGSNSIIPSLQQVFLDAITWQQGELITTTDPSVDVAAVEADDAATVLEKICRCFRVKLFQQDGVWNVVSLYSYVDPNGFAYNEAKMTVSGNLISMVNVGNGSALNYDIPVGEFQIVHPVNNDAIIYLKLPTKWIKLTYNYDQSANKVCNQQFKLGNPDLTHNGTISSTIEDSTIVPVVTLKYNAFVAFCWTLAAGTFVGGDFATPYPEAVQSTPIYIRQVIDIWGYTENRYLVITNNILPSNHARSSTFLVDVNDSIEISVDFRTYNNLAGGSSGITLQPLFILLDGDDGSKWGLGGSSPGFIKWWLLDSLYRFDGQTPPYNQVAYAHSDNTTNWTTFTAFKDQNNSILRVPVSGKCFIILQGLQNNQGTECWFKNLTITIHSYLQGSYTQLSGDYNFSTSNQAIKQTESDNVEISDSPKRYFKGALLQSNNNLWTPVWHRIGIIEAARFTQLMERIMWNLLTRIVQKIEGTFRGVIWVDSKFNNRQAGMINRYYFTEHPVPTKKFILTSFEKDLGTGSGRHVFVEILTDQNDTGFLDPNNPANGSYTFDYIFQT